MAQRGKAAAMNKSDMPDASNLFVADVTGHRPQIAINSITPVTCQRIDMPLFRLSPIRRS